MQPKRRRPITNCIVQQVEEMLDLLRMRDVADSRVGGALQRGKSKHYSLIHDVWIDINWRSNRHFGGRKAARKCGIGSHYTATTAVV